MLSEARTTAGSPGEVEASLQALLKHAPCRHFSVRQFIAIMTLNILRS